VTSRATFGDFASAASSYLEQAIAQSEPVAVRQRAAARAVQTEEFTRSLRGVLEVMARYLGDITTPVTDVSVRDRRELAPWARAGIEAQEALQNAAAFLQPGGNGEDTGRSGQIREGAAADGGLKAAGALMAAGRDLLNTHLAVGADGARLDRSEWAPVITSTPVTRALLFELGLWARQIAPQGARLAISPGPAQRSSAEARRQLNAASQWLWVLHSAVQSAHRSDPVSAEDTRLLHAIPVNALPARRRPSGAETVTGLCHGIADSAERVRHAGRIAVPQASWSPRLTAESMRQAAACGTVISHHCEILLRSMAARAAQHGSGVVSARLLDSAGAAAHARTTWLHTARAWERITTDTRGSVSPAAAEAADLALWTGRLVYASPEWTLALGPSPAARAPEALAPSADDLPGIVAAVHHSCETLTQMAAADQRQICTAARAGRLLVPTRSLPDSFDIPHPFAPAPPDRIDLLVAAYQDTRTASAQATTAVAAIAAAVHAPSRVLTSARSAVHAGSVSFPADSQRALDKPAATPRRSADLPGPVERILHDLGVTSPAMLLRASGIDQAGEQLILEAAQAAGTQPAGPDSRDLSRSAGTAELINHMLASADPRTAILHPASTWELEAET
jgi:hypothetical protein